MKDISEFSDIHTHMGCGDDCIVSLSMLGLQVDDVPREGYYSVGIHPWDTEDCSEEDLKRVAQAATLPNVVAIGECGLDGLRGAPLEDQERIFRAHVSISEEVGKPLIIHAVRSLQRIIELRKELKPRQRWIIHGYRKGPKMTQALLNAGIDLSYGRDYNPTSYNLTPPDRRFRESDENF